MSIFSQSNESNSRYEAKTDQFGGRTEKESKSGDNLWFQLPIKIRIVICIIASFFLFILVVSAYNDITASFSSRMVESDSGVFNDRSFNKRYDNENLNYRSKNEGFFGSIFCSGLTKPSFCKD